MSNSEMKDKDLESLESSLSAIENEDTDARLLRKYGQHPSWVYYYIAFLVLFFVLTVLGIINFSLNPEEPMYLSLQENIVHQQPIEVIGEADPEIEKNEPVVDEKVKKETTKTNNTVEYTLYTPEEMQKIADQITNDSSENVIIMKAEVFSFLGWFTNSQKFKKEGMDYANQSNQSDPKNFRNQRALALACLVNGQYERAKNILSGLKLTKSDPLQEWMSGYLLIEAGKIQNGMLKLEQVRKSSPSFYPASYILIQQYLKQKQFSRAYEVAQFWKNKSISHLDFVQWMAQVLDHQQQYIEMVHYLTPFEKIYPKDWTVLYYLGKGNTKLQKREVGKIYFKKILDFQDAYLVDQIGQAYFELGKIALYENSLKDSINYLTQASQRLPVDPNVRFYLASAYFKNEDYEKSIETYQQMLLKDQNDPKIRIYLGMAYFELGQYTSAEKNLQLVLNQGSNEPLLFYYLAKIEDQKGNLPKAKEYLKRVLAIEPQYPMATKMLEKINSMLVPETSQIQETPSSASQPIQ